MLDIKVLTIRDMLPIVHVEYAQVSPQALLITGSDLNQTSQILINDLEAPEFIVESENQIIAQVPFSETRSVIRSVSAIADKPSISRRSLLHFEIPGSLRSISGLEKLVQIFCRLLLQTPGSDCFRPNEGGGLLQIVGRTVSRGDTRSLQASVVQSVSRARDQVLARQASKTRMPPDERLLSATVESIGYDASQTTLVCRVVLAAVSGRQAVTNLLV